jgi:ABC-2 type transport system permease protein
MMRTLGAFLRRDLQTETGYSLSFVLQVVAIFPTVLMFYFLSRLFGDMVPAPLRAYGGTYFPFVLVGIAVQNYLMSALNSYSGALREAQLSGTLEAVLATPVSTGSFLFGSAIYAFLLNSLRIALYLAAGCLLAGMILDLRNIPGALLVIVLSAAAFSVMGVLSASFILLFKKGDPLNWFFNVISWLLGGVYYPVTVLPGWLQDMAAFIPMTHTLEALRSLLLGNGNIEGVTGHLLWLAAWAVIGLPLSCACFALALKRARRKGSIGYY